MTAEKQKQLTDLLMHQAPLTHEQEAHLLNLKNEFIRMVDTKYRRGAAEHGGMLTDQSAHQLQRESLAETIDQYTYIMAMGTKIEQAKEILEGEVSEAAWGQLKDILLG